MARFISISSLLFAVTISLVSAEGRKDMPWLGVKIQRPQAEMVRPAEMGLETGLLVEEVIEDGPFAKAGGKKGDLLWKFDDQILVNMRQLFVLLRMKEAGDTVHFHFYREGELHSKAITLGKRLVIAHNRAEKRTDNSPVLIPARPELASKVEVAEMNDGPYLLQLTENSGTLSLRVSMESDLIIESLVNSREEVEKLDGRWRSGLAILRQALTVRADSERKKKATRVRYVPLATEK